MPNVESDAIRGIHNPTLQTMKPFALPGLAACALLLIALVTPATATATVVTIAVTATVRFVDDSSNTLGNAVHPGDTVTGTYTYESPATSSNPSPSVGDYAYRTAPDGIQLSVDGLTFRTDPSNVEFLLELVNNYSGRDNYLLRSYNNLFAVSAPGTNPNNTIGWQLDDPTQTALSSVALPLTPPVLSNWQSIFGLDIMSSGNNSFLIRSDVTSAVLVPEPSSFGLLALGAGTLLALRRRTVGMRRRGVSNGVTRG